MNIFTRKKLSRKASLQLSINAIVVLVMAMVVLGLGLGFVRGLFGQGQQNLVKVIDNNVLENKASYDTPFTLDRNVKVKLGKSAPVYMGVFNKYSVAEDYEVTLGDCTFQDGTSYDPMSTTSPINLVLPESFNVPPNDAVGFRGSVYVDKDLSDPGSYICEVTVASDGSSGLSYSSSVFIEVTGG